MGSNDILNWLVLSMKLTKNIYIKELKFDKPNRIFLRNFFVTSIVTQKCEANLPLAVISLSFLLGIQKKWLKMDLTSTNSSIGASWVGVAARICATFSSLLWSSFELEL